MDVKRDFGQGFREESERGFRRIFGQGCRRGSLWLCLLLGVCTFVACRGKNTNGYNLPDGFESRSAENKIEYLMKNVAPDSVARFICDAAIGRIPGITIDLNQATLYAYEHYTGKEMDDFATEFDQYPKTLPLSEKMKLYKKAGTEDPQGLGYTLGLEYIQTIREDNKQVEEVRKELEAFRKACAGDADTYRRFMIGFKTALKADHGKDLDENVYKEFINYEENI